MTIIPRFRIDDEFIDKHTFSYSSNLNVGASIVIAFG